MVISKIIQVTERKQLTGAADPILAKAKKILLQNFGLLGFLIFLYSIFSLSYFPFLDRIYNNEKIYFLSESATGGVP